MKFEFNEWMRITNTDKLPFTILEDYINTLGEDDNKSENLLRILEDNLTCSKYRVKNLIPLFTLINKADNFICKIMWKDVIKNSGYLNMSIYLDDDTRKIFDTNNINIELKPNEDVSPIIIDEYIKSFGEKLINFEDKVDYLKDIGFQINLIKKYIIVKDELIGTIIRAINSSITQLDDDYIKTAYKLIDIGIPIDEAYEIAKNDSVGFIDKKFKRFIDKKIKTVGIYGDDNFIIKFSSNDMIYDIVEELYYRCRKETNGDE